MYTVIFSKSPFLFARLSTGLMMEGFKSDSSSNYFYHPFSDGNVKWMAVHKKIIVFTTHDCSENEAGFIFLDLEESNYLSTLHFLIDNKSK